MINHVVLMKFKPEATEEQIAELQTRLDDLPNRILEIQMYEFGRNLTECGGSYDFGLVSLFAIPGAERFSGPLMPNRCQRQFRRHRRRIDARASPGHPAAARAVRNLFDNRLSGRAE